MIRRIDFEKMFYQPAFLSNYLKSGKISPYHAAVGLISSCNHSCRWCYIDFAKSNIVMSRESLLDALGQARQLWGLRAVTIIGLGESTLHPEFVQIVEAIRKMGVEVGLFTNGSRLSGDIASCLMDATFVRVSLDAATARTHEICHGSTDFDKIIRNISEFVSLKKSRTAKLPTIGIQFAASHLNAHEIVAASQMASELGVDYLAYKPVYKNQNNPHHPENRLSLEEATRLVTQAKKNETDTFRIYGKLNQFSDVLGDFNRPYKQCLAHSVSPYIEEDGSVVCCGNLYPRSIIGNIHEKRLEEIWYGNVHRELIRDIDLAECVKGCKYHRLNILLDQLMHPDPELHLNFI
jgi:MoaA/NifB/PqqE/SkfB family radical SAM enzyme